MSRNPPQTPPGYSPLREAGGYSKDRSVNPIKTGRNDVDTREFNLKYTGLNRFAVVGELGYR